MHSSAYFLPFHVTMMTDRIGSLSCRFIDMSCLAMLDVWLCQRLNSRWLRVHAPTNGGIGRELRLRLSFFQGERGSDLNHDQQRVPGDNALVEVHDAEEANQIRKQGRANCPDQARIPSRFLGCSSGLGKRPESVNEDIEKQEEPGHA